MKPSVRGETFRLVFSHDVPEPAGVSERWLLGVWQATRKSSTRLWRDHAPISLEFVSVAGRVSYQVHCSSPLLSQLTRRLLSATCPGLAFEPAPAPLLNAPGVIADLALPRRGWTDGPAHLKPDTLPGLLTALQSDRGSSIVQLLLQPAWLATDDGPIPAFWVAGRLAVAGTDEHEAGRHGRMIAGALGQLADHQAFQVGRFRSLRSSDVRALDARRWTRRWLPPGWLGTPHQIAQLYHPPTHVWPLAPMLGKTVLQAPTDGDGEGILLGAGRGRQGESRDLRIRPVDLLRHAVVIGPSGSGKTVLLAHMAREAASAGVGLTVIDPHGGLVRELAQSLPDGAEARTSLLRFADTEHVVGLNPLAAGGGHPGMIADELVETLQRVFGKAYWGPMLDLAVRHAAAATIASHGTLVESARLLEDPTFREQVLRSVDNPETHRFFAGLNDSCGLDRRVLPAVHRLQRLLATPWLRNVLAQPRSSLSFGEVFERREILLLDLSGLGVANAKLLGSLLLLLIRGAALSRDPAVASDRPHLVLLDEASWFASPTIGELLDGVRKFGVGLVLAIQRIAQLSGDLQSAVFANAATTVSFRVHEHDDAVFLDRHFASDLIGAQDLQRLPRFEAYAQLTVDGDRRDPAWMRAPAPGKPRDDASLLERRLLQQGRDRYTVPRARVEAELREREYRYDHDGEPEIRILETEDPIPADAA